ncbi:MAG: DUF5647 family protein [Patescibacteria group bacterium]
MSKNTQIQKNINLSARLADYLQKNPDEVKNLKKDTSYVVFSADDEELNEENQNLIKSLLKSGKKVIEVEETKDKLKPWVFSLSR